MKKSLRLLIVFLLLQNKIHASDNETNKDKLSCKKDYSVEQSSTSKREMYRNENNELVILYTFFRPDAEFKTCEITYCNDGEKRHIEITQDGKEHVAFEDRRGTFFKMS